jgi:hypothetical protein
MTAEHLNGFASARRDEHVELPHCQSLFQHPADRRIVVYDQGACPAEPIRSSSDNSATTGAVLQ